MITDNLIKKRTQNKSTILRYIKNSNTPVIQSELGKVTGLSKMTVASIVNDLKKDKLIKKSGQGKASSLGGRKPGLIKINNEGAYFIAASLDWGTSLFAVLDFEYEIASEHFAKIDFSISPYKAITEVSEQIEGLLKKSNVPREKICGLGIGIPGAVDAKNGICIYSAKLNWSNIPVAALLEEKFKIPVFIETNVRLQALAEYNYRFKQMSKNLFYLNIGTGIGGAFIVNGEIYSGQNFMAGEVGHIVVEKNGIKCPCGNSGCLQMYFSNQGFTAQIEALPSAEMTFPFDKNNPAKFLFEAYRNGNETASRIIKNGLAHLSSQLLGVIGLFDPEYIVLGGTVMEEGGDFIRDEILSGLRGAIFNAESRNINMVRSGTGCSACLIGASSMVYANLF